MNNFIPVTVHGTIGRDGTPAYEASSYAAVVAVDWIGFAYRTEAEDLDGKPVVVLRLRNGTGVIVEPTSELLAAINLTPPAA